jgi:hypothetical protein
MGKILGAKAKQVIREVPGWALLSLFPCLLFKIFAIKHIPFTASWRYVPRQRKNLLADYVVNMIFFLKEIIQHPLGLTEGAPLMGEVRKFAFPEAVQD